MSKKVEKKPEDMTSEEVNDFLMEDSEDVTQLLMQKTELIKQRDEATSSLEEIKEQLATLETSLKEMEDSKNTEIAGLQDQIKECEANISTAKATVAEAEAENETLLQENQSLHAKLHKALVERVVDVKVALGKVKPENREDAVQTHTERNDDSLNDSLEDLLVELTDRSQNVAAILASANPIKKEGLASDQEPNSQLTDEEAIPTSSTDKISDVDVMKKLFAGRLNN